MDASSANVTLSRRTHPSMENTAMYMWSRTKTWLRSMDRRSRYSGRSWCAIVAIEACTLATWDSRAIVTLSRKRRCMRVLTVRRNQVAAADTASPIAVPSTSPSRCSNTPLPSSINHSARSASGRAASCDSTSEANISRGSWRYPSWHRRHMDDSAGGSGSIGCPRLGEDVIGRAFLVRRNVKALRLQIEHRSIAPSERHEFVVCAELNHPTVFKHADAIGMTYGGKSMRDEDSGRVPRRCQQAEIFDRLLAATRHSTTILISHRFSTVRHADRICVLEHGRVIELGTHDELMALRGRYRTMFDLQAERFNVPADEEGTTYDVLS